jgi:hypothetical protein
MTTRIITADQTVAFWRYMHRKYGTQVRAKSAPEMQVIGAVLASMGIMDRAKFVRDFSITLGHDIYPNFIVGDAGKVALAAQVAICVHEHVHVRQFHSADFAWDYCLDSSKRTLKECEGYRGSMEMAYWFAGRCPTVASLVTKLRAYNLTADDLAFAGTYLTKARAVVIKGGIVTPEAQVAIRWLAPRLAEEG